MERTKKMCIECECRTTKKEKTILRTGKHRVKLGLADQNSNLKLTYSSRRHMLLRLL